MLSCRVTLALALVTWQASSRAGLCLWVRLCIHATS